MVFLCKQNSDVECISPKYCENNGDCKFKKPLLVTKPGEGKRFEGDTPRYDLVPPAPYLDLAVHFTECLAKYDARNWEKGMAWSIMLNHAEHHIMKIKKGEIFEPQDPVLREGYRAHNLISAIWNLWCLYEYMRRDIGTNDLATIFPPTATTAIRNM